MNTKSIKELKSLRHRKYRNIHGKFLIEGKRLIKSAMDWSTSIESIFCTKKFFKNNKDWEGFTIKYDSIIKYVSERQIEDISLTKTPSGIAATCKIIHEKKIDYLKQSKWIYLDKIRDPGNLGSILRSAFWFGIKNIALSDSSVDAYNPKTIRSGMGAHFGLKLYRDIELDVFKKTHMLIGATKNGLDIRKFNFPNKFILVLGNEAHGISLKNQKKIENFVTIKKLGEGESLNISSAAAVLMYELNK